MPQYYPNQDVICWVKAFITEAYESALDDEQKKHIRKDWHRFVQTKGGRYEVDKYKWAWNMIAVPFGIEDKFPETFVTALYNSWEAAGGEASGLIDDLVDTSFSDELQELFDEDKETEDDECDCGDCERCLADDTCAGRCGDRGIITITDQNGKECLSCKDCISWFKQQEEQRDAEKKVNLTIGA
jgi:hypothetical protein